MPTPLRPPYHHIEIWHHVHFRPPSLPAVLLRSRSPGSPGPAGDTYDLGGGGSGGTATRRSSTPPTSPGFSDGNRGRSGTAEDATHDSPSEPPLFATVAQFCTLGVAEEGGAGLPVPPASPMPPAAATASAGGGGGAAAQGVGAQEAAAAAAAAVAVGGGGAVTPAVLPSLFPQGNEAAGWTAVSEGVRMVLSSVDHESGAAGAGSGGGSGAGVAASSASPGMFSLHSVASQDVIVKASRFCRGGTFVRFCDHTHLRTNGGGYFSAILVLYI